MHDISCFWNGHIAQLPYPCCHSSSTSDLAETKSLTLRVKSSRALSLSASANFIRRNYLTLGWRSQQSLSRVLHTKASIDTLITFLSLPLSAPPVSRPQPIHRRQSLIKITSLPHRTMGSKFKSWRRLYKCQQGLLGYSTVCLGNYLGYCAVWVLINLRSFIT